MESNTPKEIPSDKGKDVKTAGAFTKTMLASTKVTFGPGIFIDEIVTGFESTSITLTNLPESIAQAELVQLCDTIPGKPSPTLTNNKQARLDFTSTSDAQTGWGSLQALNIRGLPINAYLNTSRVKESGDFRFRLQLTWNSPFKRLSCHLGSPKSASHILRSWRGRTFEGNKLRIYRSPTNPVIVCVDGLPIVASDGAIVQHFHECTGVVSAVGSVDGHAETQALTNILNPHGLSRLQVQPRRANETLSKGWATFHTYDGMLAADKAIKTGILQLNGSAIKSFVSLSASYRISSRQYQAQRNMWKLELPNGAKLRIEEVSDHVRIQFQTNSEEIMTRSKPLVDRLVRGEVYSGKAKDTASTAHWGPLLASDDGEQFLRTINDTIGCYVSIDKWRKRIQLFGSEEAVATAKSMLDTWPGEQRQRRLSREIKRHKLEAILRVDGLAQLREKLPEAEVEFDIPGLQISFIGGEQSWTRIETEIHLLYRQATSKGRVNNRYTQTCPICYDQVSKPVRLPCKHAICGDCFTHYISSAINSKDIFPLSCQYRSPEGDKCQQRIPLGLLRRHTSQEDNNQLFDVAFFNYLNTHPDQFRSCPTANCPQIYRLPSPNGIRCPSCFTRICTRCNEHYHDGIACDEVKNDEAFREWLKGQSDTKSCPKCKAVIAKVDGCNHLQCRLCSTHFCWACLEVFPESTIYAHLERVHGGIA